MPQPTVAIDSLSPQIFTASAHLNSGASFNPGAPWRHHPPILQAANALRQGELVAFPTETVYGLGADAENPAALEKLYATKGRPRNHPVIIHIGLSTSLSDWATDIPDAALQLAAAFWPGPLTLILPRSNRVPDAVTGGQDTVGIRIPHHPMTLALLDVFGGGIAGPSANRFGRLSPTCAAHVQSDFGTEVPFILDGGSCPVGVESTIVAFRNGQPIVLRPGMITPEQIAAALAQSATPLQATSPFTSATAQHAGTNPIIRAPGTLASHYAPNTPLCLLSRDALITQVTQHLAQGKKIGILAYSPIPADLKPASALQWIALANQPDTYAQALYAQLRALDQQGFDQILVEAVPEAEPWAAIADRLKRAAHRG